MRKLTQCCRNKDIFPSAAFFRVNFLPMVSSSSMFLYENMAKFLDEDWLLETCFFLQSMRISSVNSV